MSYKQLRKDIKVVNNMDELRETVATLLELFNFCILELSVFLNGNKEAFAKDGIDDMHYVIGMCQISVINLEEIAKYDEARLSRENKHISTFIDNLNRFGIKLIQAGYGRIVQ